MCFDECNDSTVGVVPLGISSFVRILSMTDRTVILVRSGRHQVVEKTTVVVCRVSTHKSRCPHGVLGTGRKEQGSEGQNREGSGQVE